MKEKEDYFSCTPVEGGGEEGGGGKKSDRKRSKEQGERECMSELGVKKKKREGASSTEAPFCNTTYQFLIYSGCSGWGRSWALASMMQAEEGLH